MSNVWMLLLLCPLTAFATEFTHIKLNPQFEHYITRPKMKSMSAKTMGSNTSGTVDNEFENKVNNVLLGGPPTHQFVTKGFTTPFPVDGEESPLYERIREHLESAHQEIGAREVHALQLINNSFNLGTENFSGFSWQKPLGVANVWADRQVTQNLFGANWLIQDTFTIEIEAVSFLEKLAETGLLLMDQAEIGAFAGITFKRVYTYYHYADSYQNGLSADFSKLFLPFLRFNRFGIERMSADEIMKREDQWTAKVGGMITSPPVYGFSFSGGVLAEAAFQNAVSVQNNAISETNAERFRIGINNKGHLNVAVNMSIQLDFFKLIKLTLLNADLNYEYGRAREYTLGLTYPQWENAKADLQSSLEFVGVLHGVGHIKHLEPFVVRLDESSSSSVEARGNILLLGALKKTKTEQIKVIKDQVVKTFYKNYSQSVVLVQNLLGRIFSAAIYKIFKIPFGVNNAAVFTRQVTMEYEASHPQATDPKVIRLDGSEQFSFVISQSYEAAKTHRLIDWHYKNDVMNFIDRYTTLTKNYIDLVKKEELRGPLMIESNIRIEKSGFDYFAQRSTNEIFGELARACKSWRVIEWIKEDQRNAFMSRLQIGSEACVKSLGNKFLTFKTDYQQNSMKPSIKKFKTFVLAYYKTTSNIGELVALFGVENTFINGRIQSTTNLGTSFLTTFSSGQFRGLGVIDNFKRTTGSRVPASIVRE